MASNTLAMLVFKKGHLGIQKQVLLPTAHAASKLKVIYTVKKSVIFNKTCIVYLAKINSLVAWSKTDLKAYRLWLALALVVHVPF